MGILYNRDICKVQVRSIGSFDHAFEAEGYLGMGVLPTA